MNKDGTIQFEPREKRKHSQRFYSELATNLVKELPITPNEFNSSATKDLYIHIFILVFLTIKETNFSYST